MKGKRSYAASSLLKLFERQKVATLKELKTALGSEVDVTVFRKLKELGYLTSYSHRGAYYALDGGACFDDLGLWSFGGIRFSEFGTLVATVEAFVNRSEAGYFSRELDGILHVSTKKALLNLVRGERIVRQEVGGLYLYCSADSAKRRAQLHARRIGEAEQMLTAGLHVPRVSENELKAAIVVFFSLLDERQRRLYAGLQSLKLGYGGDRAIADLLGLDVHTVAKGRRQLLEADVETERVRREGGGRMAIKKNAGGH